MTLGWQTFSAAGHHTDYKLTASNDTLNYIKFLARVQHMATQIEDTNSNYNK
jgi:hypothetical protein